MPDRADIVQGRELLLDGACDLRVAVAERVGARVRAHHVEIDPAVDVGELEALATDVDGGRLCLGTVACRQRQETVGIGVAQ